MTDTIKEAIEPEIINKDETGDMIVMGSSVFLLMAVFLLGGTLATGIITGLMSAMGFAFLIYKLKQSKPAAWNWMLDHPLTTDGILSIGFIVLLAPTTATGIIAGASAAMFASAGITMAKKFIGRIEGIEPLKFNMPKFEKGKLVFNNN